MADAADPWSYNYFDLSDAPKVAPPAPRTRAPRLIPEVDELFTVQRNTLKVMQAIEDLEHRLGKDAGHVRKELTRLEHEAENAYRVIRSYLAKYADPSAGGMG